MADIYIPPPTGELPLILGDDTEIDFAYNAAQLDSQGQLLYVDDVLQYASADWPSGASVEIQIDYGGEAAVVVPADVAANIATVILDHTIIDPVPSNTPWRLAVTAGSQTSVLIDGLTSR